MNEGPTPCGMFGKIPQHGDFVSHHLPTDFTEYWHGWLQSALSVSREQLGAQWLDYYLTSPVWRFAIMPGVIHGDAVVGVLVPSVDEVGRYFPLSLLHLAPHQVWSAYLHGAEWFQQLEDVALYSLSEKTNYDQLLGQFEALSPPQFSVMPQYSSVSPQRRNHVISKAPGESSQSFALGLLANAFARTLGSYSLWWTEGSDHVDSCLLISANMPEAGQFAAMLDGNWANWGWSQEAVVSSEKSQS